METGPADQLPYLEECVDWLLGGHVTAWRTICMELIKQVAWPTVQLVMPENNMQFSTQAVPTEEITPKKMQFSKIDPRDGDETG